ncbi:MAG: RlmE family RNA methyltransferase [Desulfovibrionaceae bacterium]|nr:RlmE family RNA methyltransferase [Desulfovibrionaceae bacterium]
MKEYRDHYFLKAKRENFPARSVYKLQELDAKFKLLRPGLKLLDLGAAPGSWSLWAAQKVGSTGLVLACDLKTIDIALPPQVKFFQEDILNISPNFAEHLQQLGPFDLVLSDMAPSTTGNKFTDQTRSFTLATQAFDVACLNLKPGGKFVVKIFMGGEAQELLRNLKQTFAQVKAFKPKSSRAESKETFFTALGFHGATGGLKEQT